MTGATRPTSTAGEEPSVRLPAVSVVVPVKNGMPFLPTTLPSIVAAASQSIATEIVYVDNGSTDGTVDYLHRFAPRVRVLSVPTGSIAELRNQGARETTGAYLSFLDVDCTIPQNYFEVALEEIAATGANAAGCETHVPLDPHWIEKVWHDLHFVGRDRDVHYLNSANFFVTRSAFDAVGGFREDLVTGEDADIGMRLGRAGYRIRECTRMLAYHHGNPKSIRAFYRRAVWHGLGMFATVGVGQIDKPTAMMVGHGLASVGGLLLLVQNTWPLPVRLTGAIVLQFAAPLATVAFRMLQTRRRANPITGVFLYWLYYWARLHAAWLVLLRRSRAFTK